MDEIVQFIYSIYSKSFEPKSIFLKTWDIFNAKIYKDGVNTEKVVNQSKTTGEPPLMLSMSVFFALKEAISSTSNYKKFPNLDTPATPEKILLALNQIKE